MKFSQKLSSHLTPEWRSQYIDYDTLKNMIINTATLLGEDAVRRAVFEEEFFAACALELNKVNLFYAEKLAESKRKFKTLNNELSTYATKQGVSISHINLTATLSKRKCDHYRFVMSEMYLQLVLLQNYQSMNYTGFRKILKKYDKLLRSTKGATWFNSNVNKASFYANSEIMSLIHETEDMFTKHLEGGNRANAMKRLRVPPLEEESHPWTSFRVGYYLGALIVLIALIALSRTIADDTGLNLEAALRLFYVPFALSLFFAGISVNIHAWSKAGVNHVLIFELNPRSHLAAVHIIEIAAIIGVLLTLSLLSFWHWHIMPSFVVPLVLVGLMVGFVLNPLHIFHYSARKWLLKLVGRVVSAPFFYVGFADFWLGDQLNSLASCFIESHYMVCYYLRNPDWEHAQDVHSCNENIALIQFLRCLPSWFRFAQCCRRYRDSKQWFPHLVNAGKYSTMFFVAISFVLRVRYEDNYTSTFKNPYTWLWVLAHTVSACFGYAWDIKMDWGLFDKNAGENTFLRDHIVYAPFWYYFAIVEDFLLRFLWVPIFYLNGIDRLNSTIMRPVVGVLEIFRRFVWNFFRLENEHLNNCGQFRAVRDISVKPILQEDEDKLPHLLSRGSSLLANRAAIRLKCTLL